MHIEKREDPLVEMGYEIRDINLKAIVKATKIFFAFAIGSAVAGFILFWFMNRTGIEQADARAAAEHRRPIDKNTPLVQSNLEAKTDLMILRKKEEDKLVGAPAQSADGTYSIPIAAAMQMVAENGGKTPTGGESVSAPAPSEAPITLGTEVGDKPVDTTPVPVHEGGQP
jgi:hypothetical protein